MESRVFQIEKRVRGLMKVPRVSSSFGFYWVKNRSVGLLKFRRVLYLTVFRIRAGGIR